MEFTTTTALLAIGAGLLAGVINTIAGSGSLVTLPMLIFLGLPPHVANGTNRLGVSLQSVVGLLTLKRHGALDLRGASWFVVPTLVGSVAGSIVATDVDAATLNLAIAAVMATMLVVLMIDPKRWLPSTGDSEPCRPHPLVLLLFLGIGFYGGFIQAGVGMLLLVGLVVAARIEPMRANAIKLLSNVVFVPVALLIFATQGQVDWAVGGVVAFGQMFGAYLAARFLAKSDRAGVWIRRVLIAVVAVSLLKLLSAV